MYAPRVRSKTALPSSSYTRESEGKSGRDLSRSGSRSGSVARSSTGPFDGYDTESVRSGESMASRYAVPGGRLDAKALERLSSDYPRELGKEPRSRAKSDEQTSHTQRYAAPREPARALVLDSSSPGGRYGQIQRSEAPPPVPENVRERRLTSRHFPDPAIESPPVLGGLETVQELPVVAANAVYRHYGSCQIINDSGLFSAYPSPRGDSRFALAEEFDGEHMNQIRRQDLQKVRQAYSVLAKQSRQNAKAWENALEEQKKVHAEDVEALKRQVRLEKASKEEILLHRNETDEKLRALLDDIVQARDESRRLGERLQSNPHEPLSWQTFVRQPQSIDFTDSKFQITAAEALKILAESEEAEERLGPDEPLRSPSSVPGDASPPLQLRASGSARTTGPVGVSDRGSRDSGSGRHSSQSMDGRAWSSVSSSLAGRELEMRPRGATVRLTSLQMQDVGMDGPDGVAALFSPGHSSVSAKSLVLDEEDVRPYAYMTIGELEEMPYDFGSFMVCMKKTFNQDRLVSPCWQLFQSIFIDEDLDTDTERVSIGLLRDILSDAQEQFVKCKINAEIGFRNYDGLKFIENIHFQPHGFSLARLNAFQTGKNHGRISIYRGGLPYTNIPDFTGTSLDVMEYPYVFWNVCAHNFLVWGTPSAQNLNDIWNQPSDSDSG